MAQRQRELERRERVELRANRRCEYCRAPQPVSGVRYHLEHIIPESLGGTDDLDNVALACPMCNCYKSDHVLGLMIKDQMAANYSIRGQLDGKNILSLTLKH